MKARSKQTRHHGGDEDHNSCLVGPGSVQHRLQESRVVVLGVMYPTAFSRHPRGMTDDVQQLPLDVASDRPAAVIFHDPLSSMESSDLTRPYVSGATKTDTQRRGNRNAPKGKQRTRAEAIEAVVQELRRLAQERQTGMTEEAHGMD